MKRTYIIGLLLFLCSVATYANEDAYDRISDMKGVYSVYISKAMLALIPQTSSVNVKGADISKALPNLESIRILSAEKTDVIKSMKKETSFINVKNGYEELIRVKEDGNNTTIYSKKMKSGVTEFVVRIENGENEFTIIAITGKLTLHDIKDIVNTTIIK